MIRFSLFSVLDFYEDGSRTRAVRYQQSLEQIISADLLGFDAYWIGEHHGSFIPQHALICPNPAILLTAAAQRTRRIGLRTAITNLSIRHPLLIAEDYALVDLLSEGRLGLGLGRGSFVHEYAAFGQDAQESYGRFEESWEIIQRLWRGETVNFQGRYYHLENAKLNVEPVQKPIPRHWFSAIRKESFTMRGRATQPVVCLPHLTAESFQALASLVGEYQHQYLEAGGKAEHCEFPLILYTCVAPTRAEAQKVGKEALYTYLAHQHRAGQDHLYQQMYLFEERKQLWFGTPKDLIDLIDQYQSAMDNRHFVFWLDFGGMRQDYVLRSMHLLAQEVMPYFGTAEKVMKVILE